MTYLGETFHRQNINIQPLRMYPKLAQANLSDPWPFTTLSIKILVSDAWGSQRFLSVVLVREG